MNLQKKRILVVDDEPGITLMLKLNLERTDLYEVAVENSPTHAYLTAMAFHPDLILLDVLMPGKDGGELAEDFQTSPRFSSVPILFLTAAATKKEVSSGNGLIGGLPFLAKPVNFPEVMAAVKKLLPA